MKPRTWAAALLCLGLGSCGGDERPELWIYTSLYPQVIERIEPVLAAALPEVSLRWYQKGSEQVSARLGIELEAGQTPCDLLLTSDPFYYLELKRAGRLLAYESPACARVPEAWKDPDHAFATVRIPLMVLGVNTRDLAEGLHPTSFAELSDPRVRGRVSMGDPLKSGTTFTTVAAWVRTRGWPFLEALRANDVVSAGGNSSVLHDLETGGRPVGVVLLENLLPAIERGAPVSVVYPTDGAVPVPSPIAILAACDRPDLARRAYDLFFSDEVQDAIVAGSMYSPLPGRPPPRGAPPWSDLALEPFDAAFLAWAAERRDEIKRTFRQILRD